MKAIPEKRIKNWAEFDSIVKRRRHRIWIYRGHSDAAWKLESSLFRDFEQVETISRLKGGSGKKINRSGHERLALEKFMANAHLFLKHMPQKNKPLEWLAIMQHYGAPTRMLDFTFSPYVAMFFALESGVGDSAIYCINQKIFREIDKEYFENLDQLYEEILDINQNDLLYVYEPRFSTERLMAQQGLFLIPGTNDISHERIIESYEVDKNSAIKYIIPAELRREGLNRLRKMNIIASILFPGLDGFCKSFRLRSLYPLNIEKPIG